MNMQSINAAIDSIPLPTVSSQAVLAELSIGAWNPTRIDREITDEIHAVKNVQSSDGGKYTKLLFPGVPQFAKCKAIEIRARAFHKRMTMPFSDAGQRLLVTRMIPEYVTGITEIEQDFWGQVQDIQTHYASILAHCQSALQGTFDPQQYPTADQIPTQFKFRHARIPVPQANDFDRIASDAQGIMREEFEKHMAIVERDIIHDIAVTSRDVLTKMSERLAGDDKKIFRDSLVTNVKEWADRLGKFNGVVQSADVTRLHGQINDVLVQANPDALRENDELRRDVKGKVDAILSSMNW
jgi:hypothetical protein